MGAGTQFFFSDLSLEFLQLLRPCCAQLSPIRSTASQRNPWYKVDEGCRVADASFRLRTASTFFVTQSRQSNTYHPPGTRRAVHGKLPMESCEIVIMIVSKEVKE